MTTPTRNDRPIVISDPADLDPTLSHQVGRTDVELLDETIGQCLARIVAEYPDHDAIIDFYGDVHLTYTEFYRKVQRLASGLHAAGYRKGDRIGIWAPNRWEWTLVQFATAEIGAILVCINPSYRHKELVYAMGQSGVKGLFSAGRFKDSNYRAMIDAAESQFSRHNYKETIFFGSERWDELANHAILDLNPVREQLHPDDPINIQYTSGTTGMAKGATLTHRNILNNGYLVGETLQYTDQDKVVIPVPFFHCFGMVMGNLGAITHGATTIIAGPVFNPQSVLEAVEHGKATSLYGVPTMFMAELDEIEHAKAKGKTYDLSSLRTGIMSGTACPTRTMRQVMDIMNINEITIAYGMTETSPVNHQTLVDAPIEKRVGTVGRPNPHIEVKIVDPETGETVKRGEQGEILIRGFLVMQGYWDMPGKTADAIDEDGWMHSGDLGTMDEEGYARITGRAKDMVIRGGENLYPREIEEFLMTHPAISDVQVVGVPDEKYGEELMAFIIMREDTEPLDQAAIREFCAGELTRHKIPKYVECVDSFPMTLSGKVRKVELREHAVELLGIYQK